MEFVRSALEREWTPGVFIQADDFHRIDSTSRRTGITGLNYKMDHRHCCWGTASAKGRGSSSWRNCDSFECWKHFSCQRVGSAMWPFVSEHAIHLTVQCFQLSQWKYLAHRISTSLCVQTCAINSTKNEITSDPNSGALSSTTRSIEICGQVLPYGCLWGGWRSGNPL